MTYQLTTTHADGSQTVTQHACHDEAIDVARAALDLGAMGAAIVRPEPRGFRARVLRIDHETGQEAQTAALERTDWTRADAMTWARDEVRRLHRSTGILHRPEVEVLR